MWWLTGDVHILIDGSNLTLTCWMEALLFWFKLCHLLSFSGLTRAALESTTGEQSCSWRSMNTFESKLLFFLHKYSIYFARKTYSNNTGQWCSSVNIEFVHLVLAVIKIQLPTRAAFQAAMLYASWWAGPYACVCCFLIIKLWQPLKRARLSPQTIEATLFVASLHLFGWVPRIFQHNACVGKFIGFNQLTWFRRWSKQMYQ